MLIYCFIFPLICLFPNLHVGEGSCCFFYNFGFCYNFLHHLLPVYRPWTVHRPHRLGNSAPGGLALRKYLLFLCVFSSIFKTKLLPISFSVLLPWTHGPVNAACAVTGRVSNWNYQVWLTAVYNCIKIQLLILLTVQHHLQTYVYSSPCATLSSSNSPVFFMRVTEIIRMVGRI